MKFNVLIIFIVNLFLLMVPVKSVFALEHTQKDGLFSMDIPDGWHWVEFPEQVIVTYPDGKTMAIDIEFMPSKKISQTDIKQALKASDDKMITEGIKTHKGVLEDNKEIKFDGAYATQLDFQSSIQNPIYVTYISFFNKGYVYTITYGDRDDKVRLLMEDAVATFKFR